MVTVLQGLVLVSLPTLFLAAVNIPTDLIAYNVYMPEISIGVGGPEMKKSKTIVTSWLSLGGRGIDTAAVYGNQEEVAEAIAQSGVNRSDIFLTSKIAGCDNAEANIQKLLKQLRTDYMDLMLIHFPKGDCAAAWATLEKYHANGVLKSIGISNFNRTDIDTLKKTMKVVPHVNQVKLNVLNHDDDQIKASMEIGTHIEAYAPLGEDGYSGDIPGNPTIQAIAERHNVSTYQVALKWILQKGHLLTFQSANPTHQESDADVFKFNLTSDELKRLDNLQKQSIVV